MEIVLLMVAWPVIGLIIYAALRIFVPNEKQEKHPEMINIIAFWPVLVLVAPIALIVVVGMIPFLHFDTWLERFTPNARAARKNKENK